MCPSIYKFIKYWEIECPQMDDEFLSVKKTIWVVVVNLDIIVIF